MKEAPSYYAIIPANVRYDSRLKPNAKLLYGEITALANKEGYCWAGNAYFANLYDVGNKTISEWVSQLKKFEYIDVELIYKENSKEVDQRIIKIQGGIPKNVGGYTEKTGEGIPKKREDNNTSINNTYNISSSSGQCPKDVPPVKKESISDPEMFERFWSTYGKMIGKANTIKHWNKLKTEDHQLIINSLSPYLTDRPDKRYRKDPERYIRDKVYLDYQEKVKPKFKDYQ